MSGGPGGLHNETDVKRTQDQTQECEQYVVKAMLMYSLLLHLCKICKAHVLMLSIQNASECRVIVEVLQGIDTLYFTYMTIS